MALNRQQKRMLQRQGEVDADGEPVRTRRQPQAARPKEERTSPRQFLREVRAELRKVAWPSRSEVVNYSIIVLAVLVIMTVFIGLIDWAFASSILKLFNR